MEAGWDGMRNAENHADELEKYYWGYLKDKDKENHRLYRIFYQDCKPIGRKRVYHPLTKKNVDLDKSDTFVWTSKFLEELKRRRKFALRMGELTDWTYYMKPDVTKNAYT